MLPILTDLKEGISQGFTEGLNQGMREGAAEMQKESVNHQSGGYMARSINKYSGDADDSDAVEKTKARPTSPVVSSGAGTQLLRKIESVLERISGILNNQLRLQVDDKTKKREDFLERAPMGASSNGGSGDGTGDSKTKKPAGSLTQDLIKVGAAAAASAVLLAGGQRDAINKKLDKWTRDHLGIGATEDLTPRIKDGLANAGRYVSGIGTSVNQALTSGDSRNRELGLKRRAAKTGMRGAELNQFMAQVHHESGGFKHMEEIWKNTSAQLGYQNNKNLGNKVEGDGYRYRGRGYIQLTGRWNYAHFGKKLGIDLINHPELAAVPDVAERIAIEYWTEKVKNGKHKVSNFNDTAAVTRAINGGMNGYDARAALFRRENGLKSSDSTIETGGFSITPMVQGAKNAAHSVQNVFNGKSPLGVLSDIGHALIKQGYDVSEQIGFGGIKGHHNGAGHKEGRAIDVNIGSGNNEASNPAMRAKIDNTARELAAKGIIVLWNHKRYQGDKITEIPRNQDQHTDHFHVEVPKARMAAHRPSSQGRLITTSLDAKGAQQIVSNTTNVNTTNINGKTNLSHPKGRPPILSPKQRTSDFRQHFRTKH
jgi:putative chitinase